MIVQITDEKNPQSYDVVVAGVGEVGANAVNNMPQTYCNIAHSLKIFSETEEIFPYSRKSFEEYENICKESDYIITIVDFDDKEAVERALKYIKIPQPRQLKNTLSSCRYQANERCYSICITLAKYNNKKYQKYSNNFDNVVFVDNIDQLHIPIEIFLIDPSNGLIGIDICDVFSIFDRKENGYLIDINAQNIDAALAEFSKEFYKKVKLYNIKKFNILFEFPIHPSASLDTVEHISSSISNIIDTVDNSSVIIWSSIFNPDLKDNEMKISAIIADVNEDTKRLDDESFEKMLYENFDEICSALEKK